MVHPRLLWDATLIWSILFFIGLILGPARGLTDTGAQQPVVGASAALRWCDRLLKRHGLLTPSNMIALVVEWARPRLWKF